MLRTEGDGGYWLLMLQSRRPYDPGPVLREEISYPQILLLMVFKQVVRSESGRSPFIYWYKFQHLFYYHGSTLVTRIYITKLNIEKLYPPNEGYLIFGPRGRLLLRPLYTTCTPTPTLPVHFLIVSSLHYLYTYTYTTCTPTHCVIPTLTLHPCPIPTKGRQ